MQVKQISFKNNSTLPEQRINSGQSAVITTSDKFESSNKKDTTGKYILVGLGIVAAIVAIVKHKQIGEFFSRLFKKGEKVSVEPPIVPPKPKFELPKPEFKFNETNPIEHAKERDAYIKSILNQGACNEEKTLAVIEAVKNYGSREHLENLVSSVSAVEPPTDKLANAYLKTYQKHAILSGLEPVDARTTDTLNLRFLFDNFKDVLSKDSILIMTDSFKKTGNTASDMLTLEWFTEHDLIMKKFSNRDFEEIKTSALDAIDTIKQRGYIKA